MGRIDDETKRQRKERVQLIIAAADGLREVEIAQKAGLEPRTTNNYLRELELEGHLYKDGALWFALDVQGTKLRSFQLSPEEAYTLYLAARLLVKQHDKRNEPAETALMKLAKVLSSDLGVGREISQAAVELARRPPQQAYQTVFRTMVQGYLYRRKVELVYRPYRGKPFRTAFSAYLLEPSAIGFATYAIGYSSAAGALRSYKVERIESARLTSQPYDVPADFPGLEILRHAWSIIAGEETIRVELRFSPAVKERVLETCWHPSQGRCDDPDQPQYLRWWVDVADTTDMLPWIRGWGADVEVLEPKELREKLAKETQRLARMYCQHLNNDAQLESGDRMDIFQQFLTLPGKTEPRLTIFEHSSDVFHITLYLLSHNQATVRNPHLVKAGALLHDVGKIAQDIQIGKQWTHQPHSAKYLRLLLEHPRMKALLGDNGVDLDQIKYEDLLVICEHHHDLPTQPALLRRCPEALLVSVADVIASSLESGWLGAIRTMLTSATYTNLNLALLENLGLDNGLGSEIHRVDLPGDSVADALLNDLIYRDMSKRLASLRLEPVLQKGGSLWVAGDPQHLRAFLEDYTVNPRTLYESAELGDEIYDGVLAAMPAPGSVQMDSIRYLLVNEQIARKVMLGLLDRKRVRQALEHFDVSLQRVHETFGVRSRTLLNKLEAVGESPRYLITGAQAAYQYHHWRAPAVGDYELLINLEDFDTWYSYLRDSHIYVGKALPTQKERERYFEAVILKPELTEDLWRNRVLLDDAAYIAPTDLLFRLVTAQTEEAIGEALAIIVARRQDWDWASLVSAIKARRMPRQFGCLFELLNQEAKQLVVPAYVIESLRAVVQDTVGEAVFTFPLRANRETLPTSRSPAGYAVIGKQWGLELLLPRHLVGKVLDDLGA